MLQALSAFSSHKSSVQTKKRVYQHWWNDTDSPHRSAARQPFTVPLCPPQTVNLRQLPAGRSRAMEYVICRTPRPPPPPDHRIRRATKSAGALSTDPGFESFSLTTSGPSQRPSHPNQWVLSKPIKRPKRQAGHSPPYSAQVKNKWSYTSAPLYTPSGRGQEQL
jgi:hypothetical protein